jgi:parvulin-like peptidyl-prolyl isomerase
MRQSSSTVGLFLTTCFLLATLATGCDRQKEGEEAVAWVNGEPIRFSVFWDEIKNRYNEVEEASSPQQDVLLVLKKKVLSDLIRERLLLQEASRRGITVPDEALEARIEELRAGYTGSPLRKSLIKHAMDYDQWREALRENMVIEALFANVVQDAGKVTEQEVSQYYREHLDEFLIPEAVQLDQIVVKSRSTAQRVLRLIRKGEDFGALAAQYSIGPEKEQSGRLGTYRRGELPVLLERAAFSTPTGKVTSLVETQHGFHLLKVVKRIPSHMQSEAEAREEIARKLSQEKEQVFYDEWVEALIQNSDIRVHASLVQLVVKEEPTQPLPFKNEADREAE